MAQYDNLSLAKKEIRVLVLFRGSGDEAIFCYLQTVSLLSFPKYEALSYVWGSPDDKVNIHIGSAAVQVTRNLHAALKRLRLKDRSRVLWVDAVCINQNDTFEKQHQVGLMSEIYSKTTRALIWLGDEPEEKDSDQGLREREQLASVLQSFVAGGPPPPGFEAFHTMFQNLAVGDLRQSAVSMVQNSIAMANSTRPSARDRIINKTRPCVWKGDRSDFQHLVDAANPQSKYDTVFHAFCLLHLLAMDEHPSKIGYITFRTENDQMIPSQAMGALHWIAERPWFKRIWTVQECLLPPTSLVFYGPVEAPWSMFFNAISNLQKHRTSCCSTVPGIDQTLSFLSDVITHMQHVLAWRESDHGAKLDQLLRIFRYRKATDPRDKVYGLLSLVTNWGNGSPIVPDYAKSTTAYQVFARTTAKLIQQSHSLDVLSQLGNVTIDYFSDLPSWVVDFSISTTMLGAADHFDHQIPLYNACGGYLANARSIEDNILVLDGVAIDRLGTVSEAMFNHYDRPDPKLLQQWYDSAKASGRFSQGWEADFLQLLCGDTIMDITSGTFRRATTQDQHIFDVWAIGMQRGESFKYDGMFDRFFFDPSFANRKATALGPAVKAAVTNRKFFITQAGRMGLAPNTAGESATLIFGKDEIFVFPGGKTPFLLRSAGRRHVPGLGMKPCYHFLGECYLHGFMDGEAMKNFEKEKRTIYLV